MSHRHSYISMCVSFICVCHPYVWHQCMSLICRRHSYVGLIHMSKQLTWMHPTWDAGATHMCESFTCVSHPYVWHRCIPLIYRRHSYIWFIHMLKWFPCVWCCESLHVCECVSVWVCECVSVWVCECVRLARVGSVCKTHLWQLSVCEREIPLCDTTQPQLHQCVHIHIYINVYVYTYVYMYALC